MQVYKNSQIGSYFDFRKRQSLPRRTKACSKRLVCGNNVGA